MSGDEGPSLDGWEVVPLSDVATTQLGKTINPREKHGSRQRRYLRNANVQWDRFDLSDVAEMHFNEQESLTYRLQPGDLLVCEGGIVGRGAIWRGELADCHFQNALHRVRPMDERVSAEWLLENMRHLAESGYLAERARGNTIQHLSQQELRTLPIVLPPRSTQDELIVAISEIRAKQASARFHLADGRRAGDRLRQAVLIDACTGRLSADWRSVLEESTEPMSEALVAGDVAPSKLRRGVDPSLPASDLGGLDLPASWAFMTVAQLLSFGALVDVKDGNHGANHPKVGEFTAQGVPFITANCVRDDAIDYEAAPKVSGGVLKRLRVGFSEPGDVVLTHKGTVGRVAVASEPAVLTPQTTYYRCADSLLAPRYLAIFMKSLYFYLQLAEVMSQTTRDFVPISEQYKLTVIVPPIDEQRKIVVQADQLLAYAADVERRVDAASRRVERTSQVAMAKVFRGNSAR